MQQVIDKKTSLSWVAKVTLYFSPDGLIDVVVGNQRFHARSKDVEALVRNYVSLQQENVKIFRNQQEKA